MKPCLCPLQHHLLSPVVTSESYAPYTKKSLFAMGEGYIYYCNNYDHHQGHRLAAVLVLSVGILRCGAQQGVQILLILEVLWDWNSSSTSRTYVA